MTDRHDRHDKHEKNKNTSRDKMMEVFFNSDLSEADPEKEQITEIYPVATNLRPKGHHVSSPKGGTSGTTLVSGTKLDEIILRLETIEERFNFILSMNEKLDKILSILESIKAV
jgi:hypothetical protein